MIDAMQSSLFEDEILRGDAEPAAAEDATEQLRRQLEEDRRTLQAEAEAARTDAWQARQERDRADNLRIQAEWQARQEGAQRAQAQQLAQQQADWLRAQQTQAQALRPPAQITGTDLDAIMSDPAKLQEAMDSRAAFVWQAAQQEMQRRDAWHEQRLNESLGKMGQYFEGRVNALGQALAPVNALSEDRAANDAEAILTGMGIPVEKFREALPKIKEIVRGSAPGQAGNPQAFGLAYFLNEMNQPAQRERPTPPMSLSSDPSPTPRRAGGNVSLTRDQMVHVAKIKDSLGSAAAKEVIEAIKRGEV